MRKTADGSLAVKLKKISVEHLSRNVTKIVLSWSRDKEFQKIMYHTSEKISWNCMFTQEISKK